MSTLKIGNKVEIGDNLALIAGPCVAESRELCLEIADFMRNLCESVGIQYIFKASFDKANRSSIKSFRGPGIGTGLDILSLVKSEYGLPICTDVHDVTQVDLIAEKVDLLQVPAFLCRQTDLLIAAGKTGKPVNIKKGQFMAPEDMRGVIDKVSSSGNKNVMLTERGTTFGYHNLVVDMRSLVIMKGLGVPVVFDATHSVQLPGGLGDASGGQSNFVPFLARAAVAVGIDALFMEVHPRPDQALCDGPNSLDFKQVEMTLKEVKKIYDITTENN